MLELSGRLRGVLSNEKLILISHMIILKALHTHAHEQFQRHGVPASRELNVLLRLSQHQQNGFPLIYSPQLVPVRVVNSARKLHARRFNDLRTVAEDEALYEAGNKHAAG